eukprot:CAMPEP_0201573356 /NCGR_PEP_ID=MMETSP0190_2-20130828/17178_1 /ASSEMBLY_ACC=CAM_ASM_000263 /TAXON_ID=37353 /ORGANISM="Rosalina sp." /LENGTH=162 /DNA_ID=CAMNT_0048000241 /DNA_START=98 /DNA_END=583 /DNA_ORIENTATION=+
MEQQVSAPSMASKYGEHTHTMTNDKSMEIGYHCAETIYLGVGGNYNQKMALQEDEEIDVFDVREPGSPMVHPHPHPHHNVNIINDNSSINMNIHHDSMQNPYALNRQMTVTNGIADDEFVVVDGGESSHDIVTRGGEDCDTHQHVDVYTHDDNDNDESDPTG